MPKAEPTSTTPAPIDPPWTIGDIEPLLHDMEAQIGILSHVANSRNQIEPGELILVEDKFLDLHKQMMALWHDAWNEHLCFRHGERPPLAPDGIWDLLRTTAKLVLEQCEHPERIPSTPIITTGGSDADPELIAAAAEYSAATKEIRRLEGDKETPDEAFQSPDARRWAALARVTELPAKTLFGLRAKALVYATETDLRRPDLDRGKMDLLAESIARDVVCHPVTGAAAEPAPADETPPTVSTLAAYVEGLAGGIKTMATRVDGTPDSAISTISTGLALALERAHPGAALIMGRSAALVFSTEKRGTVTEFLVKRMGAATPAPEGDLGDLFRDRPDATVLHLARELMRIDARVKVLNEVPDSEEAGMDAVLDRQHALFDTLIDTPAKTVGGWRAKGEVLVAAIAADISDPDPEHRLAISLAEDLMARIKPAR